VATDPAHSAHRISLKLRDITQLFNSMDPSPFIERDLDDDAVDFIVSWAQEFPPASRLSLHIYLEQFPHDDPTSTVRQAVHAYFANRATLTQREFRLLMTRGRTSLFIGLVFLTACLVAIRMLPSGASGTWVGMLRESLTIAGWVAMWRPMEIYLYDWWPLQRRRRVFTQLSRMSVDVRPHASHDPSHTP
jgi:hypothetical protein